MQSVCTINCKVFALFITKSKATKEINCTHNLNRKSADTSNYCTNAIAKIACLSIFFYEDTNSSNYSENKLPNADIWSEH